MRGDPGVAVHLLIELLEPGIQAGQALLVGLPQLARGGRQLALQALAELAQLQPRLPGGGADLAQLQAALQAELTGDHRALATLASTPRRCCRRGASWVASRMSRVGLQPGVENQAAVGGDRSRSAARGVAGPG